MEKYSEEWLGEFAYKIQERCYSAIAEEGLIANLTEIIEEEINPLATELREVRKVMDGMANLVTSETKFVELQIGKTSDGQMFYAALSSDSGTEGHSMYLYHEKSLKDALAALVERGEA